MRSLLALFVLVCLSRAQEIRSSDFFCSDEEHLLKCPTDSSVFIHQTVAKYSKFCNSEFIVPAQDFCVGIIRKDAFLNSKCNGKDECILELSRFQFDPLVDEANCNFTSNYGNVVYSCLPNFDPRCEKYQKFDICNPQNIIQNIQNGFILSPNYPNYYSNNRECRTNIIIPKDKRLVVYLIKRSLEEKSLFGKINDYLTIENDDRFFKFYGYSDKAEVIYDGNDREVLTLKFISDWITTSKLRNPKGFIIYFEFFDIYSPTTTTTTTEKTTIPPSTTTTTELSTEPLTEPSSTTTTSIFEEKIEEILNSKSESIKNDLERTKKEDERLVTIIVVLISVIGVLVLIIFGLLLMYRRKQKQHNDQEDRIYDTNDSKSVTSSNYNDEYHNVSIISTAIVSPSSKQNKSNPKKTSQTFNDRLKRLYKSINQTINLSTQLIGKQNTCKEPKLDESKDQAKVYRINEFDYKYETDTPVDKLKLCQSPMPEKKNENPYVTILPMSQEEETESQECNSDKLKIYEVNFENNFAYITSNNENNRRESEIYQSINDFANEDDIYSTPTNKQLIKSSEPETGDNSVLNLLNSSSSSS